MEQAEDLINRMTIKIIKTLKMPLHVSILRSSSGSTFCSLLKLYINLIILLNVSVMRQHIVCMCICCICCREVGRQTSIKWIIWMPSSQTRIKILTVISAPLYHIARTDQVRCVLLNGDWESARNQATVSALYQYNNFLKLCNVIK